MTIVYPERLTRQENEDLTRVGKGTPMGDLLRRYWHPVLRAGRLEPDGAPVRVRLLGESFVAFRATDGRLGFFAERCPHRGASLALAHNSGNGLRCIFHGWKIDVSGKLAHVPTEPAACAGAFAEGVKVHHYPAREAGGLLWTFIGEGEPPEFPDFEFTYLPLSHIDIRQGLFHCNWVQGMEAVLDSAHLGQLHRSSFRETFVLPDRAEQEKRLQRLQDAPAPRFEIEETPFGFKEAAIRDLPGGVVHANLRQFVAPYYSFLPGGAPGLGGIRTLCVSVPNDDEWASQFFITYNAAQPLSADDIRLRWRYADPNPDNFAGELGDVSNLWGQNREAMQAGHASGFPNRHSFHEDFIVQESMGPITDRTDENLGSSDTVIDFTRRRLLRAAYDLRAGQPGVWGQRSSGAFVYRIIRGHNRELDVGVDWRGVDPFDGEGPALNDLAEAQA